MDNLLPDMKSNMKPTGFKQSNFIKLFKQKKEEKKPKLYDDDIFPKEMLRRVLDGLAEQTLKEVREDFKDLRTPDNNLINEEADEYDRRLFDMIGIDHCVAGHNSLNKCSCSRCLMEDLLTLDMILSNSDTITNLKGKKVKPACKQPFEPSVKKRGNRYYLVAESDIKNFNVFYPISDILSANILN